MRPAQPVPSPRAVRRRVSLAASAAAPPTTALDALRLARAAWERTQQQQQLFSPEVNT